MSGKALPALAKLALDASRKSPSDGVLLEALEVVRKQTGAVAALVFYNDRHELAGRGVGDEPSRFSPAALAYLQRRLARLRLPLAFDLEGHEVRYLTRAESKQSRDYIAWPVPTAEGLSEMLLLRGSWPASAVTPLLDFVESAMPALTILMERFLGVGLTDALTGLLNHRGALEAVERAVQAAASEGGHLSVIMGDIDGFKLFNDTYGHVAGDEILNEVAGACRAAVGSAGTVCRYGGDEFLVLLPDEDKEAAGRTADAIDEQMGHTHFRTEWDSIVPLRLSLGIAAYPEDATSALKLVAVADAAMYAAKSRIRELGRPTHATKEDSAFGILESLVRAVDAKDRYTKDHCDIVAEYAVKLATRLGLSDDAKRALRTAGLLHDIGKIAVPDEILKKPGPLTDDERASMRRHVKIGEALVREVPQLKDVIQAVSCHHERYDGSGYPRGLKGEEIPVLGRVIAVADAYSAMSLDRPYRKALASEAILEELRTCAGSQFDPSYACAFIDLLRDEEAAQRSVA
jgi:diguanylate cyclase (GGDEF)-like protein/putative nucleotidyltransferase with HDIG domain